MQYISSYQTGSVGPILNIQTPQAILLIYAVWQAIKRGSTLSAFLRMTLDCFPVVGLLFNTSIATLDNSFLKISIYRHQLA
jgi:hypothetical protein